MKVLKQKLRRSDRENFKSENESLNLDLKKRYRYLKVHSILKSPPHLKKLALILKLKSPMWLKKCNHILTNSILIFQKYSISFSKSAIVVKKAPPQPSKSPHPKEPQDLDLKSSASQKSTKPYYLLNTITIRARY